MKKILSIAFAAILLAAMTVSCTKDLDIEPIDPNQLTSNIVFIVRNPILMRWLNCMLRSQ